MLVVGIDPVADRHPYMGPSEPHAAGRWCPSLQRRLWDHRQSSRLSSPSLAPAAKAPYQPHDGRFPAFIRSSRQGFKTPIGRLVHAARPGRKFIHQAVGAAEPAPDLAGAPVRALAAALELSFVSQAMTEPAAETRPVQDATSTIASGTFKPSACAAERCLCRPKVHDLIDGGT